MNRKIMRDSGYLDEIPLVYQKAENDEFIGKYLEALEEKALEEVRTNLWQIRRKDGSVLSESDYENLSESDKEYFITLFGDAGWRTITPDFENQAFCIQFSPKFLKFMGCTIFNLLNRFEKLDGRVIDGSSKWTVEFQVPIGAKKGLLQWEILFMKMFPWAVIQETSSKELEEDFAKQIMASKQ
jgi:hypothetical protein